MNDGGFDPVPGTESEHCCDVSEMDPAIVSTIVPTRVPTRVPTMASSMNKEPSFKHGY